MSLTLIAALTWPGRVIGRDNALPWKLSADLKRFKALTLGHPVVMGRKTWESLPFKLPGRHNLVLSRQTGGILNAKGEAPDACSSSLPEILKLATEAPGGPDCFVIGGASVYAAALPFADRLALTLVHHAFEGDALFPEFDRSAWVQTGLERHASRGTPPFDYEFLDLKRS